MIHRMILSFAALMLAGTLLADDEWTAAETQALVRAVRHPPIMESWAIMTGHVRHKAHGEDTQVLPIELRARFAPQRSLAQLVFNDQEMYMIGQNFGEGIEGTSVIPVKEAAEGITSLQDIGIRPSDLTLSFLYWDFVEDLGEDSYKGRNCRILVFQHPEAGERVQVWVSTKYSFPMQVKWYYEGEEEPYRQLEITDLKKVNDVYMVSTVKVSNPGWKTEVKFRDIDMEEVKADEPVPEDLFLPTE